MKILVTGANGQLGNELRLLLDKEFPGSAIYTDIEELDLTDPKAVEAFIVNNDITHIVNCAAYNAVDRAEEEKMQSTRINNDAVKNLAIAADANGAKIIHISTDYVFDGHASTPYTEFDATAPKTVYGKTKLAGEYFVKEFAKEYFIVRTAWLYGDGKNFVKTMLGLAKNHDKVTVVGDQFGSPTSADELAGMIAHLLPTDNFGVFHGTCEGVTNWADFTRAFYGLAGISTVVETVTTEEYDKNTTGIVAPRPAYSVLDNYMLRLTTDYRFADWEKAIADYIKSLSI